MTPGADQIQIERFHQIFHMPLVWQSGNPFEFETRKRDLQCDGWEVIDGPLSDKPEPRTGFAEFVYFHDFVREFLYKPDCSAILVHKSPGTLDAVFRDVLSDPGATFEASFTIKSLQLRLFDTGVAILKVELECKNARDLSLAHVQTIIDHLRRSYTPYWIGDDAQGVPLSVKLSDGTAMSPQNRVEMTEKVTDSFDPGVGAKLFEHWRKWTEPLGLGAEEPNESGKAGWRDPSDERVPAMSYIELSNISTPRETFKAVSDGDWFRLAEADPAGSAISPYNDAFLERYKSRYFYDRFMPCEGTGEYVATRHVFGGAHYAMVTVQGAPDFLRKHFSGHYEKMAMIARFEFSSLLGFSSRISRTISEYRKQDASEVEAFRSEILKIQREFLNFTHRYHFTGISSQIQASEMFTHWRDSLDLDTLYKDVCAEIESAASVARAESDAQTARRQADDSNKISRYGLVLALIFGAFALVPLRIFQQAAEQIRLGFCDVTSEWCLAVAEFLAVLLGVALIFGVWLSIRCLWRKPWKKWGVGMGNRQG